MAYLQSHLEWNDLKFVKSLEPKYREALKRVHDYVAPLLGTRPLGAEELTDHDVRHSIRVLERAAQILPEQTRLNQPETYILCLAALLHDAGLWTTKNETLGLLRDEGFRQFVTDSWSDAELGKVEELLTDERLRWMGELSLSRLTAWYHRSLHPSRLLTAVLEPQQEPGNTLRVLIGAEYVDAVAVVSIAHSWTCERLLQDKSLADQQFGDEVVSVRFLAALLRLGDLLDLGEGRVSGLLWAYLAPLAPASEAHWRKEATLKLKRCGPELIRIAGHFDADQFGMMAAEAHRLAQDWISMLCEEIEGVALVLNSRIEPEHRHRLQFGRMELDANEVKANGLMLGGKVAFELNPKRVLQLLSKEIYGDRSIFIRELLQNAVDATRTQLIRDKRAGSIPHSNELTDSEPWNWPHSVTDNSRYQIKISASPCGDDVPYVTFSIADQGIGMSLADIRDHFLQVGKSFYTTSRYRQEFSHTPISQFGIGFLSCLAVADRVEVITRQRQEHAGLRLILQKPSEHFIVEAVNDAQPGTTVNLQIAQKEMQELRLPTFPIRSTHFFTDPTQFCDAMSVVVSQWAAYLEFPVKVQETRIPPRDPATFVPWYIFDKSSMESLPVKLLSEDGREIGRGRVFYDVLENTHLPSLHSVTPQTHTVASFRGVGLSEGQITFANQQLLVALDFRRLPPQATTAGRKLNLSFNFFEAIGGFISRELHAITMRRLEAVGEDYAVLWSRFLDRRMGNPRRDATKVPVRTDAGLTWLTWEQASQAYPRLALVPFYVAWKGQWSLPVPAVGVPNDMLDGLNRSQQRTETPMQSIQDCDLVSIDHTCSGYLWPPAADAAGLELFVGEHTYSHIGLVKWPTKSTRRRLRDSVPIDRRLVEEAALMQYDQQGDPWHCFGVHQYSRTNDGSVVGKAALELLQSAADWSLDGKEIVVRIQDANDWV